MAGKQAKTKSVGTYTHELITVSVSAMILLAAVTAVSVFAPAYAMFACIVSVAAYVFVCAMTFIAGRFHRKAVAAEEAVSPYLGDIMTDVMTNLGAPAAITSESGVVIWHNSAFAELADALGAQGRLRGAHFSFVLPVDFPEVANETADGGHMRVETSGRVLSLENYRFRIDGRLFFMLIVHDETEAATLEKRLKVEHPLVAHIQIDNLSELTRYEQGEIRDAGRDVDAILKDWARSHDAILREYDRNKYMMIFSEGRLDDFASHKFDVLDRVREIRIGSGQLPVTVSIGISLLGKTLDESERASLSALDTALQRGGDQAVLVTESGTEFYGGRTKTMQRRTKVRSRVIANEVAAHIKNAGNVLVMGHRYPDFDSIGSCIGAARLALREGADVHIVVDVNDDNIAPCIEHVRSLPEYEAMFVDEAAALDMIRSDTLVMICDVNSSLHLYAPDVADSANEIIIIDHHIKAPNVPKNIVLTYIEPSASSASELLADMIEQMYGTSGVTAAEADVMYAGILLDTKQLSRSTTARTFSAAMYLQSCGANAEIAVDFFRSGLDDFTSEARFESNVSMYRDIIAISYMPDEGMPGDRVSAAKAADKLLTVRGVTASFALVKIGGVVHISARSTGDVNVQLVLERLGGGGHFDVAGAQLGGTEIDAALEKLRGAIDDYFAESRGEESTAVSKQEREKEKARR